jgi:hypothetical protein
MTLLPLSDRHGWSDSRREPDDRLPRESLDGDRFQHSVIRRVRSQDIHFDLIFDSRDPHFYNLLPISQTVSVNR